jgi:phosphonopyruvate decarboxylase
VPAGVPIVSTTGMASRELFEYRKALGHGHGRDFLTVGGMGHACQIAAGIALARPARKVVCLDGDGAMLMHLGALAITARRRNMVHVVINNGAHDSVGGQPTLATELNLVEVARSLGYGSAVCVTDPEDIAGAVSRALASDRSAFIEIGCRKGARADLGRPDTRPQDNKAQFMRFLAQERE